MSLDQLDFLVQQTMEMSQAFDGMNPFAAAGPYVETAIPENIKGELNQRLNEGQIVYPESSGIIFYLKQNSSTFTVRAKAVTNISKAFFAIHNFFSHIGDDHVSKNAEELKVCKDFLDNYSFLDYFSTDYLELAEVIVEQISNRRFIINEEQICNVSDPGPHWWLKLTRNSLKIFFRTPVVEKNIIKENSNRSVPDAVYDPVILERLGPVGDSIIGPKRFKSAYLQLQKIFPLSNLYADDRQVSFGLDESTMVQEDGQIQRYYFEAFQQLLLSGKETPALDQLLKEHLDRTLYYFFNELSGTRRFWMLVSSRLQIPE
ncbi:MAG: hypothetical protein HQK53_08215 [Oligoflexia bacterium]|nr:hypothetical protein [Oligoflexia bacterium]